MQLAAPETGGRPGLLHWFHRRSHEELRILLVAESWAEHGRGLCLRLRRRFFCALMQHDATTETGGWLGTRRTW